MLNNKDYILYYIMFVKVVMHLIIKSLYFIYTLILKILLYNFNVNYFFIINVNIFY